MKTIVSMAVPFVTLNLAPPGPARNRFVGEPTGTQYAGRMRAYVDESEPGGGRDHTAYVLAAVIISVSISDAARADVRAATPRRMRKLHWYEALPSQRISWLDLLRHAVAVIVVRYDGAVARTERRRRRCIERLVHELELRKVGHVVLETRGPARDKDDRAMFDALRDRGVGHGVRFEHLNPSEEPLLALADIACGAHVAGLAGDHGLSSPILVS
ncbi:DUF3800 domain-containing protein [Curtobacterium sp. MCLR17_053]|uniref:DUF3800 domain-containing protein n=2 Tax=Microbacteriaceae TaxID=85023 RepID=UPI0011B66BB3